MKSMPTAELTTICIVAAGRGHAIGFAGAKACVQVTPLPANVEAAQLAE